MLKVNVFNFLSKSLTWYIQRISIYSVFLQLFVFITGTGALCPPQCRCNRTTESVDCRGGRLAHFPIQLSPRVQHLQLDDNLIADLHGSFDYYTHLQQLSLRGNRLVSVENAAFVHQSELRRLDLSANQIATIREGAFDGLGQLQRLTLSHNQLRHLPADVFTSLKQLSHLSLSDNFLGMMHEAEEMESNTWNLGQLRKLKQLDLSSNQLVDFPQITSDLPSLLELNLRKNSLTSAVNLPDHLVSLDLSQNKITNLTSGALPSSLQHLNLSGNSLVTYPEILAELTSLSSIDISGNDLIRIGKEDLSANIELLYFYCCNTPSLSIVDSDAFTQLTNLQSLHLCNNSNLTLLQNNVISNPTLTEVDFSSNRLSVPPQPTPLSNISSYNLINNTLRCTCRETWLRQWIQLGRAEDIVCATPLTVAGQRLSQLTLSQLPCERGHTQILLVVAGVMITVFLTVLCVCSVALIKHCRFTRHVTNPVSSSVIARSGSCQYKTTFNQPPLYLIPLTNDTQVPLDVPYRHPMKLKSARDSSSSVSSRVVSLYSGVSASTTDSWYELVPPPSFPHRIPTSENLACHQLAKNIDSCLPRQLPPPPPPRPRRQQMRTMNRSSPFIFVPAQCSDSPLSSPEIQYALPEPDLCRFSNKTDFRRRARPCSSVVVAKTQHRINQKRSHSCSHRSVPNITSTTNDSTRHDSDGSRDVTGRVRNAGDDPVNACDL